MDKDPNEDNIAKANTDYDNFFEGDVQNDKFNNNDNDNTEKEEKIDMSIFATSRGKDSFKNNDKKNNK